MLFAHPVSTQHGVDIVDVDAAAADMWSAGTSLYLMLTGELPFAINGNRQYETRWHRNRDARKAQDSWVRRFAIFPHPGHSNLLAGHQTGYTCGSCMNWFLHILSTRLLETAK